MDYNILSPYVRFALYSVIEPPFTVGWRIIFDYELIFVDGGGCRLTVNGTEYLCKKGDVIFIKPNVEHRFDSLPGSSFIQPHVHFDLCTDNKSESVYICYKTYSELTERERELVRNDIIDFDIPTVFTPESPSYFRVQLLEVIELFKRREPFYQLLTKQKMLGLLYLVFSRFDKSKETCGAAPSLDMLNIKSYIDGNYTQRITLNHLAGRFYINKYCLEAEFKKQFGITVIKYLNSVRFEKACAMLTGDMSISEIYEALGFDNIYSFSRFFKNMCGSSPTAYRKTHGGGAIVKAKGFDDEPISAEADDTI